MKAKIVVSVVLLLCPKVLWAKNSMNWLEKYLYQPRLAGDRKVLALVEVTNVAYDHKPPRFWKTGTLTLRTLEAVGGSLPRSLRVRFSLRETMADGWTWDDVEVGKGRRLLGFFNHRNGLWEVPTGYASGIIQNVEHIRPATRVAIQKQFNTPLLPPKRPHQAGLLHKRPSPTRH